MKTIEITDATASLAEYARDLGQEPVIVTIQGKPVAALVAIGNADLETVTLSNHPQFLALIERSRARQSAEEGFEVEREPLQETDIVSLVGGPETPLKRVTKEKTSVLRALLSNSEELVRSAPLAFCSEFFLWRVSIPPQT